MPITAPYRPRFTLSNDALQHLASIERARTAVDLLPLPLSAERRMRRESRVRVAHNSTWIENRTLALDEARHILERADADPTRDASRAELELRNYWEALAWMDAHVEEPWSEALILELHAIVDRGLHGAGRPKNRSAYRTSNLQVGRMAYLPPEHQDVPDLMQAFVAWLTGPADTMPGPVAAAFAAYQFVTIHPFDDGNGRTCRLIATWVLQRRSYGMRGLASMESFYAADLDAYYDGLQMGLHHNYYESNERGSRSDPDLSPWLDYFLHAFARASDLLYHEVVAEANDKVPLMRQNPLKDLPRPVRRILGELEWLGDRLAPSDVASWFGVSPATARSWLVGWTQAGFFAPAKPGAQRTRYYVVAPQLRARIEDAGLA